MLPYFIQANLYLLLFYGFYAVFLRRETFFNWNRRYLLIAVGFSLAIPAIPTPRLVHQSELVENMRDFSEPVWEYYPNEPVNFVGDAPSESGWSNWLGRFYRLVVLVLLGRFLRSLYEIGELVRRNGFQKKPGYYQVNLPGSDQIYSFFYILFWGENNELSPEEQEQVIRHEQAHIQGLHSLDMLLLEGIKIFFWFNPASYLLKRSMRKVHEYLADRAVIQEGFDKKKYASMLLEQSLRSEKFSLGSSFFSHSPLKSRIQMMNQTLSKSSARLKYAVSLGVMLICVLVAACSEKSFREVMSDGNNSSYQVPEGYEIFKSYRISTNTPQRYSYFFFEGSRHFFGLISKEGKEPKPNAVVIKVYQRKDENDPGKMVASNFKDKMYQNGFDLKIEENAFYDIEVEKLDDAEDFTFLVAFKKPNITPPQPKTNFAQVSKQYAKEYAAYNVPVNNHQATKVTLDKRWYTVFLNAPIPKGRVKLYIIDPQGVGTYEDAIPGYDYLLFSFTNPKTGECEIRLESDVNLENYEVLLF